MGHFQIAHKQSYAWFTGLKLKQQVAEKSPLTLYTEVYRPFPFLKPTYIEPHFQTVSAVPFPQLYKFSPVVFAKRLIDKSEE